MILRTSKFGPTQVKLKSGPAYRMSRLHAINMGDGKVATQWQTVLVPKNAFQVIQCLDDNGSPVPSKTLPAGKAFSLTGSLRLLGNEKHVSKNGEVTYSPLWINDNAGRITELVREEREPVVVTTEQEELNGAVVPF